MSHQSAYHRAVLRDKGTFEGKDFLVSTDSISWIRVDSLSITEHGQLYSSDEHENHYLLLQSLQSCHVQILTNIGQSSPTTKLQHSPPSKRNLGLKRNGSNQQQQHQTTENSDEEPPTVFIKTFDNDKLYIKVASKANFGNLISSLIVWQNLKPQGLAKKWYCENKVGNQVDVPPNELLVCRFKIYGPLPNKYKNLNIIHGPQAPTYQPKIDDFTSNSHHNNSVFQQSGDNNINEGWFYAMGALNSNGILNIISELDGTLLYSIDVKTVLASEIREMHHSIFNSSNVLFVGQLKELRYNNTIRTSTTLTADQLLTTFLTREGKIIPSNHRIFIEFPLHIDLEDWFVGLNYFAKREYIGSFNSESKLLTDNRENPQLRDFSKAHFRVSKKLTIDIIEAKFEHMGNTINNSNIAAAATAHGAKIYAEVRMWGYPWSRTAIVNHTSNPFWKEEFSTDLPISTQMIHILIKKCNHDSTYSPSDKLIGTIYVTPDILTKQIRTSSTIMTSAGSVNSIHVNSIPLPSTTGGTTTTITTDINSGTNLDIMRLTIYDPNNIPIGKLLIEVNLKEHHILPPQFFKPMEKMLVNAPWKDLIKFCNENVSSADFERTSVVLLDIFQSLGVEDEWFKNLMESELVNLDRASRRSYHKRNSQDKRDKDTPATATGSSSSSSNNVFNTLFRGSSIFSKSLEKYNLRIGQEYLEKVFGDFFAKIDAEGKNCEVDPRYVRVQERAIRKGYATAKDVGGADDYDYDDESSDDEYNSDLEREKDERVKQMVEENYQNLLGYAEEIWHKIFITSKDMPDQIKTQLKNFRSKVELVCEPDDKTTSLNCVSAFLFLRFFCPAILNPKLFYLAKNHQTGSTQRTLTLIAKILLNLANRQEFSVHKEPHLIKLNPFLRSHKDEVITYFNRITGRSNDFNEKILDLSHELKRINLGLDQTSNELPSTPYLIDHYLRLTELAMLIATAETSSTNGNSNSSSKHVTGNNSATDAVSSNLSVSVSATPQSELNHPNLDELDDGDENHEVYKIGALEFERNDILDLAGEDNADGFIHSLCKDNEHIFSFINENITLKDIQNQSKKLAKKIHDWDTYLENYEFPMNYYSSNNDAVLLWQAFSHYILKNTWLDSRGCLSSSSSMDLTTNGSSIYRQRGGYKNVVDDYAMASLKLKFGGDEQYYRLKSTSLSSLNSNSNGGGSGSRVFSGSSIGSSERSSGNEGLKKIRSWFKR
ncbi:BUD2 [Candida margitis]|uniref:BUD2 n=1 Tax=Candida margitis TaxID=1775924 RepID=UPI002227AFFE|nr:BUD2 [Candida margitis]KAI5968002.1 BUD2 [Candida margitis]